MSNTSASGGYLAPTSGPLEGNALQDYLQAIVVGITGLPGAMVRPRWQAEPPNLPDFGTDWAAFGVIRRTPDTFAAEIHNPAGSSAIQRSETMELLASFYGPNADNFAGILRDGLLVGQNRAALAAQGMALVSTGEPATVPALIKERWTYRVDLPVTLRRVTVRQYTILNIQTAGIGLDAEAVADIITVQP